MVFTGQVSTAAIGSDAFQEVDIIAISRACTKWNVMVKTVADLPRLIDDAFNIATSGRPGPVLVDLPKDITAGTLQRAAVPTDPFLSTPPSAALPVVAKVTMADTAVLGAILVPPPHQYCEKASYLRWSRRHQL